MNDWIEYRRREDRERLGWLRPEGDGFVAVDLLGLEVTDEVDWVTAEEALAHRGLGYLALPYELLVNERRVAVRIVEASPDGVRVKVEDFGAIDAPWVEYSLPFPVPEALRPQ